jgi:hypothetical protein
LLLPRCRSVHTFGMRFRIDVAVCDPAGPDLLVVRSIHTLGPGRAIAPRLRASSILEAEAGAFAEWALAPGQDLVVERCA